MSETKGQTMMMTAKDIRSMRAAALEASDNDKVELCDVALDRPTTFGGVARGVDGAPLTCSQARAQLSATKPAKVEIDTSVYRSNHGVQPRGRGSWAFVMGREDYKTNDEIDDEGRPLVWWARSADGQTSMPFTDAKKLAVAEAQRRGVTLVGVAS